MDKGLTDEEYRDLDKAIENQKQIKDAYERIAKDYDALVLDVLVRQKAEIDRLNARIGVYETCNARKDESIKDLESQIKAAKAEAYKEFAERLKEKSGKVEMVCSGALVQRDYTISEKTLDNLVKEMVGDDNA